MSTRFRIEAIFKGIDKFSAPVAKMTTRMDRFTRRLRKGMRGIGKMTKRMARGFRNSALTLGSLAVMGGFALKGLLGPATRFQHAMDGVNAVVLGAYTKHMPKLREVALKLGKETTFTATQVANAMEVLAKSGLAADETLSLIEPTLKGAEAAGSDISTMADILVSTIAQMKSLSPKDGTDVIDAYAVAASSANTTLEELGEGMKKVIPIGEGLNFSFKDLLATTTLLQHMGIEASMSAAQQRTFFTRLASLTPKAAKSFKALGIDIMKGDKSGNIKTLPNLLSEIAKGFSKIKGNKGQIQKMAEAVGLRGGIAGNILIRNMDQLEGLLLKIGTQSEGASGKMAGMRLDNLYGDLVRVKSAWEAFRIEMASDQLPHLRKLVQSITAFLGNKENIDAAAEKLDSAVKGLKDFWTNNKSEIKGIANTSWDTVKILAGITADLALALGWLYDFDEKSKANPFVRFMNSLVSDDDEYYRRLDAGLIGLPSGLEPVGLKSGYTQEKSNTIAGEIIVRDESGVVVGVQSSGLEMSLERSPIMSTPSGMDVQ